MRTPKRTERYRQVKASAYLDYAGARAAGA